MKCLLHFICCCGLGDQQRRKPSTAATVTEPWPRQKRVKLAAGTKSTSLHSIDENKPLPFPAGRTESTGGSHQKPKPGKSRRGTPTQTNRSRDQIHREFCPTASIIFPPSATLLF